MKKCTKCKQLKPLSEFTKADGTKDGLRTECRQCKSIRQAKDRKRRRRNNQCQYCDHTIARCSTTFCHKHYLLNKMRHWTAKKRPLSITNFVKLLRKQRFKCAICKQGMSLYSINVQIDHNHKDGQIRGILCKKCNLLLGYAKDSSKILKNALKYIENPPYMPP